MRCIFGDVILIMSNLAISLSKGAQVIIGDFVR